METYKIVTDAVSVSIDAESEDAAASAFAESEGIKGVKGVASLLAYLDRVGGYGSMMDGNGDMIGRVHPDGGFSVYPRGKS